MSQQVQELIDKIKNEGIVEANNQAGAIKTEADAKAQEIISQAQAKADQLIADAKVQIQKMEESGAMALKQASRDTLLSLRQEIENILQNIVRQDVGKALSDEDLSNILAQAVVAAIDGNKEDNIEVAVNKKDLEALKSGAFSKLKKEVKDSVKLQGSSDVAKGFTISFDEGKSNFDFSDESLASYLTTYLNSQISSILNETSS
jgi:V/A-type H+-transporting ATPase subunit E